MDGAMELPEDVKEQLAGFEAAVGSVEEGLEPLLGADRRELEAQLTPVERAKVHVTLANAVSTLFCMYLKTVGLDPADHAVKRELERVELYRAKVDKAASSKHPTHKLDVAAANRFIENAAGGNGGGGKKGKKEAGAAGGSAAEEADAFLEGMNTPGGGGATSTGKRKSAAATTGKGSSKKGKKK